MVGPCTPAPLSSLVPRLRPRPSTHHAPSENPKGRGVWRVWGRDYRLSWFGYSCHMHIICDSDTRRSLRAEDPGFTSQRLNPLLSTRPQHTHSVLNDIRESILLIGSFSSHFRTSVSALQRFPLAQRRFFFFWAQFSRELARLYEYSYRPCAVCLLPNFVLCCNRRLVREVSRERKQARDQCGIE